MTIYLDHAATTPMVEAARAAVLETMGQTGNPSSLHASGRRARRIVEESRETIAEALGARPGEVIFTGGGTESDNLAVKGLFWSRRTADSRRTRIITTAVEHHAVLDTVEWLVQEQGARVTWLPVDRHARTHPGDLVEALHADGGPETVALVSVMLGNNEVGTVNPVADLAAVAHEFGVPFHTDAVQAVGSLPVSFAGSGVDAMTVTAHKFGGPQGVGALLATRELGLTPLLHGGGQEREVRSGTLDTPSIAGFAAAARLAVHDQPERAARVSALRDELIDRVRTVVPGVILGGHPQHRLPGNAHLRFLGCEGDALLLLLDARGVECSTGSACSAGVARASHVLSGMGLCDADARASLRVSLGWNSTRADVDAFVEAIGPAVERARAAALVAPR